MGMAHYAQMKVIASSSKSWALYEQKRKQLVGISSKSYEKYYLKENSIILDGLEQSTETFIRNSHMKEDSERIEQLETRNEGKCKSPIELV